jgi:hypothetical protein
LRREAPGLAVEVFISGHLGGGPFNVIPAGDRSVADAPLLRAQLPASATFVLAATIGVSNVRIAMRHLLPNARLRC